MCVRSRGVTLLELMTAIAVLAVLAAVGVPAFSAIVRNNQIAGQSANLVAAMNLARSEALKRGTRVSVCAAADNDTCAEDGNWTNGWIVFADDFGDMGVLNDADTPIQVWPRVTSGVDITTEAPSVTFTRSGRAEFAESLTVSKNGCTGDQKREIAIGISGRIGLQRTTCP